MVIVEQQSECGLRTVPVTPPWRGLAPEPSPAGPPDQLRPDSLSLKVPLWQIQPAVRTDSTCAFWRPRKVCPQQLPGDMHRFHSPVTCN